MPKPNRYAVVTQYKGRRQTLAQAAHAYISFYESHAGYDIDWDRWTVETVERVVEQAYVPLDPPPQCLCEEDFVIDLLWAFVSNDAMLPEYEFAHGRRGPVLPPATTGGPR
jgi:hypothetical protein